MRNRSRKPAPLCGVTTLILLSLIFSAGCDSPQWTTKDEWYSPLAPKHEWLMLKRSTFESVPNLGVARNLLADRAVVRVDEGQLIALGLRSSRFEGNDLYLVRAVCLSCTADGFSVATAEAGRVLLTEHTSFGGAPLPMRKTALVVALPRAPEVVYAICSMAE